MAVSPTAAGPTELAVCDCTKSRHEHGERGMYGWHRCRCVPCCDANREYNRRAAALRRPKRVLVDAAPVRERIALLRRSGLIVEEIAALAGVSARSLDHVISGRHGRLPARVSAPTAKGVMGIRARDFASAPERSAESKVDGAVPALRLQALQAAGWTVEDLAERSALRDGTMYRLLRGNGTTVEVRAQVEDLYQRLRGTTPPQDTALQQRRVRRALKRAEESGWTPWMADDASAYARAA